MSGSPPSKPFRRTSSTTTTSSTTNSNNSKSNNNGSSGLNPFDDDEHDITNINNTITRDRERGEELPTIAQNKPIKPAKRPSTTSTPSPSISSGTSSASAAIVSQGNPAYHHTRTVTNSNASNNSGLSSSSLPPVPPPKSKSTKPIKPPVSNSNSSSSSTFYSSSHGVTSGQAENYYYSDVNIQQPLPLDEASDVGVSNNNGNNSSKMIPSIKGSIAPPPQGYQPLVHRTNLYDAIRKKREFNSIGEPNNMLYHVNSLSTAWIIATIVIHCIQWALLLAAGSVVLPVGGLTVLVIIGVLIPVLLAYARMKTKKATIVARFRISEISSPETETDDVPNQAVIALVLAALLEGCMFALYTALVAGVSIARFQNAGIFTQATLLQSLRFASITFLAFHRCLRPANRVDPMRTIMELEVVSVCWDALDGSTLFQLLDANTINSLGVSMDVAIRVLMVVWYVSVGVRIAVMFLTHLPPNVTLYSYILPPPLAISPHPTVDRTLAAMRLRSLIIACMTASELYAGIVRLILWSRNKLDSLQQDMTVKNFLFVTSIYGAYSMWMSVKERYWNDRDLGFGYQLPSRSFQLSFFRYGFAVFYLLQGALFSTILVHVTNDKTAWVANVGLDVVLVIVFLIYCRNVHKQSGSAVPRCFLLPQNSFVLFPAQLGLGLSALMSVNLFIARVPAMYNAYENMAPSTASVLWTYNNAMLVVVLSVLPIAFGAMFWSTAYLLFREEFTACPGNYNAIHDPIIGMVSTATMIEGSMDMLSCTMFMQLAAKSLPPAVNGAVILFCLLECLNACQCFALQAMLSGGQNDTPLDLVRWKAYLRACRFFIDFGAFALRMVLWIQYGAISSSLFLIKNLYNLLHSGSQVERYMGVKHYSKQTLFTNEVSPLDWYNLTKEEWRAATRGTIVAQVRAGRTV